MKSIQFACALALLAGASVNAFAQSFPTKPIRLVVAYPPGGATDILARAITPKAAECTNLLVPGAASFTHVAFCTYRLESVWMMAGHAAGIAAAMAAKTGKEVQQVDVPALQTRLREQKQVIDFIPGEPEKWTDIHKNTGGPKEF